MHIEKYLTINACTANGQAKDSRQTYLTLNSFTEPIHIPGLLHSCFVGWMNHMNYFLFDSIVDRWLVARVILIILDTRVYRSIFSIIAK